MSPMSIDVVVAVSGGVVTGVFSDSNRVNVVVIDWDEVETASPNDANQLFPVDGLAAMPNDLRAILNKRKVT